MSGRTRTLWTVGHSNHDLETFLDLVRGSGVEVVVDVRSVPRSRYWPHFNREPLHAALERAGVGYVFLGDALGGRPEDDELYDADGRVRYDLVARTGRFRQGLERLLDEVSRSRVALMCSEEDPQRCHRRLLVGRALADAPVEIAHIRKGGTVQPDAELPPLEDPIVQHSLFDEGEQST